MVFFFLYELRTPRNSMPLTELRDVFSRIDAFSEDPEQERPEL
ncbi:hypothetical protein [Nonomuraea sp. NPDC048901]